MSCRKIPPRGLLLLVALGTLTATPMVASAELARADAPEGFVTLFKGKDLTDWRGLAANPIQRADMSAQVLATAQTAANERMRAHWHVIEGVLECDGMGEPGDNLCTSREYGNFEMYVDWRILPGGDSGIYVRGTPQIQIWDPTDEAAWENGSDKGSGAIWNNQHHDRFPLMKADHQVGEWNTFYIKMIGERVTVKLNGQLVVDDAIMENYWAPDTPIPTKGSIELQSHGNKAWFRNIFVRDLPE